MQKQKIYVLPSQAAINAFARGLIPDEYMNPSFVTSAEVEAFLEASTLLREAGLKVHSHHVNGNTALFDVSYDGGPVFPRSKRFDRAPEACAFDHGLALLSERDVVKIITSNDRANFERLSAIDANAQARRAKDLPTIVVYKTADQITRVVASQEVRVIVLDADSGVELVDAPRVLHIGDQELYVSDLLVNGRVGEHQNGEQGIDAEFVEQVVRFVEGMPAGSNVSFNKPGQHAEPFPILKSVPVKHWEGYEKKSAPLTHQIDIDDQRLSKGQFDLVVGALEGQLDNHLSVTAMVKSNPQNEAEQLPCVSVHFNEDAAAFTAFKVYDKILLQPAKGVVLSEVQGPAGPMYVVE